MLLWLKSSTAQTPTGKQGMSKQVTSMPPRDSLTRHKRLRTGEWKTTTTHAKVEVVVLLIGATGTTYKEHTLDQLVKKLGLTNEQAGRLLTKLTRHSLEHATQLKRHRYHTLSTSTG
jgi:hypothetical protein